MRSSSLYKSDTSCKSCWLYQYCESWKPCHGSHSTTLQMDTQYVLSELFKVISQIFLATMGCYAVLQNFQFQPCTVFVEICNQPVNSISRVTGGCLWYCQVSARFIGYLRSLWALSDQEHYKNIKIKHGAKKVNCVVSKSQLTGQVDRQLVGRMTLFLEMLVRWWMMKRWKLSCKVAFYFL